MILEKTLKDTQEKYHNSEKKAHEILKAQEKVSEKWRAEHHSTVKQFECIISEMQSNTKRLEHRNSELIEKLA